MEIGRAGPGRALYWCLKNLKNGPVGFGLFSGSGFFGFFSGLIVKKLFYIDELKRDQNFLKYEICN